MFNKVVFIRFLSVLFFGFYFSWLNPVLANENFKVFDATLYKNKPDLTPYGIEPATVIYGQFFWKNKKASDTLPDKADVTKLALANKDKTTIQILDIEHWKLRGSDYDVNKNLNKYLQVLRWYKETAGNNIVGYYGLPVGRDYWRAIKSENAKEYIEWRNENSKVIPLADEVDASFPSLYTFYNDPEKWVKYAIENIKEARRLNPGKPVYPFLWPKFHDSNFLLKGKDVPAGFWRLQLDTLKNHADGVVIWGGWDTVKTNKPFNWDKNAKWWSVTQQFINEHQLNISAP